MGLRMIVDAHSGTLIRIIPQKVVPASIVVHEFLDGI